MSDIPFGPRLKALRLQSAYPSATGFAKAMEMSRATLYLWEASPLPPPAKHWPQLCAVLGISEQHLLLGVNDVTNFTGVSVQENSPLYGHSAADLANAVRKDLEQLIAAAGNDTARMGWIVEQFRLHLNIPPHWLRTKKSAE